MVFPWTFDTAEGAPSIDAIGDFNMQVGAMRSAIQWRWDSSFKL